MKKMIIMATALTMIIATVAFAAEVGDERKGKFLYKKIYKTCFEKGAVKSEKPALSPDAKTQGQWTRVLKEKNFSDMGCPEEWAKIGDKELQDIFAYLHAHAADSPAPAKCK